MPISMIYQLFKIFAPMIIIGSILAFVYYKGGQDTQQKWDIREQELANATVEILYQAKQHNSAVENELVTTKQQIKEISHDNNAKITILTNNNRKLLANRMRWDSEADCSSNRVSENTGNTSGSIRTAITPSWRISEASGNAIITDYEYADRLNESLRACRTYVTKLKEQFK